MAPSAQGRLILLKGCPISIDTHGQIHRVGGATWRASACCGLETSTLRACFKVRQARQHQLQKQNEDEIFQFCLFPMSKQRGQIRYRESRASWRVVPVRVCRARRLVGSSSWSSWLAPIVVWSRKGDPVRRCESVAQSESSQIPNANHGDPRYCAIAFLLRYIQCVSCIKKLLSHNPLYS